MTSFTSAKAPVASTVALGCAAAVAALAVANHLFARRTERRHPPRGSFITVDGVRLHYRDEGEGSPVVLIHGNVVSGDDWETSGVAERLRRHHRVIIFDRPGFGHSKRPQGRVWTAARQADLLHKALGQLGVARPVVAGHSWGSIVALELAAQHPADVAGLVLVSGYYYWTVRPDVPLVVIGATPGVGDLLRYTVSPALGWVQMPLLKSQLFAPAPQTDRFKAEFSDGMALRPSQIRATSEDGALMLPGAIGLRNRYDDLTMPVTIIAGDGDRVVFPKGAERLADAIPGSVLRIVAGAGHMVHHTEPEQIAKAIEHVTENAGHLRQAA